MQAKSPLGGCLCMLRNVSLFVTDSSLLEDLRSGLAQSRLREMRMCAVRRRWQRILLYGGCDNPRIRDENTGEIRFADTDDLDDFGILPGYLDYVNPFWVLYFSKGRHEPLDIICDLLGNWSLC